MLQKPRLNKHDMGCLNIFFKERELPCCLLLEKNKSYFAFWLDKNSLHIELFGCANQN